MNFESPPAYSIASKPHGRKEQDKYPGPGQYFKPDISAPCGPTIGKGLRADINEAADNLVGPGHYNVAGSTLSSHGVSFKGKTETEIKKYSVLTFLEILMAQVQGSTSKRRTASEVSRDSQLERQERATTKLLVKM